MLDATGLKSLLGITISSTRQPVTVYTSRSSPRLEYVCRFIFEHALNISVVVTCDAELFKNSNGYKINYSSQEIEGSLQVIPQDLLFETDINRVKPIPVLKNDLIYFFENARGFHFDIFSAVFFFISRYEEWQDYQPDKHGRFEATESILFSRSFHLKPVVDIWIRELAESLKKEFSTLNLPERKFRIISTIDVDNLFAFRFKGLVRTLGATIRDSLKLDLKNIKDRMLVLSGRKKDPFDIYEEISSFCFDLKIPLIYFFLFRTGTEFDRSVNPANKIFKKVFDIIRANKALLGLHPSYHAAFKEGVLNRELKMMEEQSGERITLSRQHFLRFDIRTTPALLRKSGLIADFSMGFASAPGFRAGTSLPFYYYDLANEKATDFLLIPFCTMDGVYMIYEKTGPEKAIASFKQMAEEVRKVNGLYMTIFHERTFSDHLYPGFGTLYKKLLTDLKQ